MAENHENSFKLYEVTLMKSKKEKDVLIVKKDYVKAKDQSMGNYQSFTDVTDRNGKNISVGYTRLPISDVDKLDNFVDGGTYDIEMYKDENDVFCLLSGVKVTFRKEVMNLKIGQIREGNNGKYLYLSVEIPETEFESSTNKEEIVESFASKGLKKGAVYNGNVQFSAAISVWDNEVSKYSKWENETKHISFLTKTMGGNTKIHKFLENVFENGKTIKITGLVEDVKEQDLTVVMFTNWETIKSKKAPSYNCQGFTIKDIETIDKTPEGNTLKLTYKVNVIGEVNVEPGDEITFEITEERTNKIFTPKIQIELNNNKEVQTEIQAPKEDPVANTKAPEVKEDKGEDKPPF